MRRRLYFLFSLVMLFYQPGASVNAQSALALSELQIAFWPEYDRQAMLVIYRGTLAPEAGLPASLSFPIPAKYGPPVAVAYQDVQGQLFNLEYTATTSNDEMQITFATSSRQFQFEYYDTSLDTSSATRNYRFTGKAAYPIQSLILQVQQPMSASALTTTPDLGERNVGGDGLTYAQATQQNVNIGDAVTLDLSYVKNDSSLSVGNLPPAPVIQPTLAPPTPGLAPTNSSIPMSAIVLGLLGIVLVGGGVWWFGRSQRKIQQAEARPRPPRVKAKKHPPRPRPIAPPAEKLTVFCHQCGQAAQPGDTFCRNCGTKLRR